MFKNLRNLFLSKFSNQNDYDVWSKANFLLSKWQHHDKLMYDRLSNYCTLQSVLTAGITIIAISFPFPKIINTIYGTIFVGFLFSVIGFLSLIITNMIKQDKLARNSYNSEIVALLKNNFDLWKDRVWEFSSWCPDINHKINNWHLYNPDPAYTKGKSSIISETSTQIIGWIEIVIGVFFIIITLIQLIIKLFI